MLYIYILALKDVVINGNKFSETILEWEAETNEDTISNIQHEFVKKNTLLYRSIDGLESFGDHSLSCTIVEN